MPAFLVDEDIPRSLAVSLREAGFQAEDVRDAGLRGHSDAELAGSIAVLEPGRVRLHKRSS